MIICYVLLQKWILHNIKLLRKTPDAQNRHMHTLQRNKWYLIKLAKVQHYENDYKLILWSAAKKTPQQSNSVKWFISFDMKFSVIIKETICHKQVLYNAIKVRIYWLLMHYFQVNMRCLCDTSKSLLSVQNKTTYATKFFLNNNLIVNCLNLQLNYLTIFVNNVTCIRRLLATHCLYQLCQDVSKCDGSVYTEECTSRMRDVCCWRLHSDLQPNHHATLCSTDTAEYKKLLTANMNGKN